MIHALKPPARPFPSSSPASPQDGQDRLARAFLEVLASEEGSRTKTDHRGGWDDDDPVEQLIEEGGAALGAQGRGRVRPDLAAAAVLLARTIDTEAGLMKRLRREAPVVTIATRHSDLVEPVREVVEKCAIAPEATIFGAGLNSETYRGSNAALVIARDGSGKDDRPEKGNGAVAVALNAAMPVVGIAADPARTLPRMLLQAAEHRLQLPELDASALALVIETVAGAPPEKAIDPDLVRRLVPEDLAIALRSGRGPDECVALLQRTVESRRELLHGGPSLEELDGYGEAKAWGLELAADLADLKAGRIGWEDVDHKGLLLSGPPGVGKTAFAKALAKTAAVPLVSTSVAEWNASQYLSGTLQAMRKAFDEAARRAPSILFIDEADGISDRARISGEYLEYWTQVVNCLLELLAGVSGREGVVVIAATNHPDRIDAAIKRAGRLDREIAIARPDAPGVRRSNNPARSSVVSS